MSLDINMIRSSFEKAKPIAGDVANKFYEFLFQDYPAAKGLFTDVNMAAQKKALINSLVYIVDHLEDGEKLTNYLKKMGSRHVNYGTEPEHYSWVGQSLLKTFAFFFGDEWTPELKSQWTQAYTFIAETMLEGAENKTPEISQIREKARAICNNLLLETIEEQLDENFKEEVRAKVRSILVQVLEEESEKLFHNKKAA